GLFASVGPCGPRAAVRRVVEHARHAALGNAAKLLDAGHPGQLSHDGSPIHCCENAGLSITMRHPWRYPAPPLLFHDRPSTAAASVRKNIDRDIRARRNYSK